MKYLNLISKIYFKVQKYFNGKHKRQYVHMYVDIS